MNHHASNYRTACLKAYMTRSEKAQVLALAKQAHLTTSELVRRLVLGQKLPDVARHEAVLALVNINADLARLGNLLRMALADEDFVLPSMQNVNALLSDIRTTQRLLKNKIVAL